MTVRRRTLRTVTTLLIAVAVVYVALCALLWMQQDRMVFPGAGRGDAGIPATSPGAAVQWIGPEGRRTRIATVAVDAPRAVVVYFGGNGEDLYMTAGTAAGLARYGVEAIGVE